MTKQWSKRMETEDKSRIERLLGLLRDLPQRDPSPALRKRLSELAFQQLREKPEYASRLRGTDQRPLARLKPIFVAALLIAIGFTAAFVVHLRQRESVRANNAAKVRPPAKSSSSEARTAPAVRLSEAALHKSHHPLREAAPRTGSQQMTVRLPYSNSAVATGTDATIRVSISQSELLSLGFPVNDTFHDRRVVAELTLGDDGLPRAISVPLPLEVIKEKK